MATMTLFFLLLGTMISLSPSAAFAATSSSGDIAVVGCGVLGTSLCKQLLSSPDFGSKTGEYVCMYVCMRVGADLYGRIG